MPPATQAPAEKFTVYMTAELAERLRRIAATRRTTLNATTVKLLEKGADWYDALSGDQREAV